MAWNRKHQPWSLIAIIFMVWQCSSCQSNNPADQAAKSGADHQFDQAPGSPGTPAAPGQARIDAPDELFLGGERGAPIKIEVFSDYQCPRCRDFYLSTLKPLIADYTNTNKINKIYIVYHDFPLEMHPFARKAARFALAAARIGRDRWLRVNDALYTDQAQWSLDGNIEAVLAKVLEPTELVRIGNLAADPAIDSAVQDEVLFGQSCEIASTPTFFINPQTGPQQRVAGWVAYNTLKDFLDRLLK